MSQFIITAPWLITTQPRWENWIRRTVLSGLLKRIVTVGLGLEHSIATCVSEVTVNNVLWKGQSDIPSRFTCGDECRYWRFNTAVMKQIFFIFFNFFLIWVGQY